ncbi:MAG: hypothetical protein AAF750_19065 [Planctomycetota bacterium]
MRLEQADRLLVLLHYADGLQIGEIASVLDQPAEDVSRRLDDLRWRLAQVMRDASVSANPAEVKPVADDGVAASG